jgi:hypothetical protein
MFEKAFDALDRVKSPPLVPDAEAIDFMYLARMTLGARTLEHDILRLFDWQAEMLAARIDITAPRLAAASAHTLKSTAQGIGAWRIARLADEVEVTAGRPDQTELAQSVAALRGAIVEARTLISEHLCAH